jgi:hypothetical protein
MCDATSIVMGALGGLQALTGFAGQSQAAQAQQEYQEQLVAQREAQMAQNRALALQAYQHKVAQEQMLQRQADASATQALEDSAVQAAQAKATARVSAGEAGVAGVSLEQLLADFDRQEALYRHSVQTQRGWELDQSAVNMEGYRQEAQSRIASVAPYVAAPVQMPSMLATGLQIGSSAFGAYDNYQKAYGKGRYANASLSTPKG